ncbi:hypothetical protein ARTSIC4J27_2185 [Pseudarthrobacter siccitolerans]|uniref:Uncharacterized protein n=1 Tax=Pseudarthrobacter siccitolerans TaxID=861266 RepID=A0A024H207_9MICC|nr:hypothetical protein ARTSIC4J27_2185 [Pseudarthrobacter siccitolerans]
MRILRAGQPPSPVRQRARMERGISQPVPARCLPAQIEGQCLRGFPVREALQGLQHQHRADHRRRNRRPAPARRKQILHHRIREQPPPVPGQKSEDTARSQQLTGQRLHIQIPALRILASLHKTSLNHQPQQSSRRARPANISAVS